MKKLFLPLIALAILCSCEKSSEVDVIAEEGLIGVSLRLDKGFAVSSSDSSVDSSWPHIFQDLVDITFSSTTSSYSKTVSFNPNDVSSFPNTSLPYDTYNWSIANTGGSVAVSSALYIYGSSSSTFTVSSASTTIPLSLSTDFALVTVSETNLSGVSISQGGTDISLTTNNGFYYGYINSAFSDYTVTFTSVENQSASDTITNPSASTHYNYTISYEGGTSVTVALSDTFQLEERGVTIGSSVNLTNGLLAWYPFNGNANDESGNGNDGTVNGATLTADRNGNNNSSYSFDGIDDFIVMNSNNNELDLFENCCLSIAAWINIDNTDKQYGIFTNSNYNETSQQYALKVDSNSKLYFLSGDGLFESNGLNFSTSNIDVSSWTHVVVSYDGNTLKLYLNGSLDFENEITDDFPETPSSSAFIGNSWGSNNDLFPGRIDDIGIWNRALTETEIQALYNETDSDLTN